MPDFTDTPSFPDNEGHLWTELETCVSDEYLSHESIDDALRQWLSLTTQLREMRPNNQEAVVTCAQMLIDSKLYHKNKFYVRTQLIHSLLQEEDTPLLHAITVVLLLDGHYDITTYPRMIAEACFPRVLELTKQKEDDDPKLHRLLLQLMYEMSRMARLKPEELVLVDDAFIHSLFRIIEGLSDDINDPYHYPIIRVLLVLNEQYMLASTDTGSEDTATPIPITNRIVKCLCLYGPVFRTFGENIILLLNRETETSLQLLILKLLYLLFTTKGTYEYFYTNDLRVLLDVIIRNIMDLPDERMSLRHTYLRVLYPLLAHTQLCQQPHYKQDEILRVLMILRGTQNAHFAPADETTLRLVERVAKVEWLQQDQQTQQDSQNMNISGQLEIAQKYLGISLSQVQGASSVSVGDIAKVMETPGVQTPSRNNNQNTELNSPGEIEVANAATFKRPLPATPPNADRTLSAQVQPKLNGAVKRVPPKAPPPRRFGKYKAAESASVIPITETQSEHL